MTVTVSKESKLVVNRKTVKFAPNPKRVIARLFIPGDYRQVTRIISQIQSLSDTQADCILQETLGSFSKRHRNINDILLKNYSEVEQYVEKPREVSKERKMLIGAYFTREYSIESAALFNPSIVADPDQSGLASGCLRCIISFRATGEGHLSSIEFRRVVINNNNEILSEELTPYLETDKIVRNMFYNKNIFGLRLFEMSISDNNRSLDRNQTMQANEILQDLLDKLDNQFNYTQLQQAISATKQQVSLDPAIVSQITERIDWLAKSNYQIKFNQEMSICERVIFPSNECKGIEDARFVRFVDNGQTTYYALYTVFDGTDGRSQLLETKDFLTFNINTLNCQYVNSKGMALFPRKIHGKYTLISRHDGQNLFIMYSDDILFWHDAKKLEEPQFHWEFIQIGNCGSPIETEAGWLLLTHGVGPMRRYCIGAKLLDIDDPTKVISQLSEPLLIPNEQEREGYVPNVVYSCGAIVHNDELIIPYAMSDFASGIATISLSELLSRLLCNNR